MKKLNVGSEAVYDYTFNAQMVGCSRKPQNLKSMLDLDDFDDPESDFTKVWSRENYDHLDCEPGKVLSRDVIPPMEGPRIVIFTADKFREG